MAAILSRPQCVNEYKSMYLWDLKLVITAPADVLASITFRPSAGTTLSANLGYDLLKEIYWGIKYLEYSFTNI